MIATRLALALVAWVPFAALLPPQRPAVGTITEMTGIVEIQRDQSWQRLLPLLPLYPGDVIRVLATGQAVLAYFGGETATITTATSPYTVKSPTLSTSLITRAVRKLADLFDEMTGRDQRAKANLIVRGVETKMGTLQPNRTDVLFPEKDILFRWPGSQPPYTLILFREAAGQMGARVYSAQTHGQSLAVKADVFTEETGYSWIVTTEKIRWEGRFRILSRAATADVQREIKIILDQVPRGHPLTKAVLEALSLMSRNLIYNSIISLHSSSAVFPASPALQQLRAYLGME